MKTPHLPFDALSAYHDQQPDQTHVAQTAHESLAVLTTLRNLETLSRACQNLSQPVCSDSFFEQLSQQLESLPSFEADQLQAHNEQVLARALQALPQPEPSLSFMANISATLEQADELQAHNEQVLARALQALPQPEPSLSFMANLSAALEQADQLQAHNEQVLARALKALPQPEPSAGFMVNLSATLEQLEPASSKKGTRHLFALPTRLKTRALKMVAGIAAFGLLATVSHHLMGTQGSAPNSPTLNVALPAEELVTVENQPEDIFFSESPDLLTDTEHDNEYYQLIGG